MADARSEVLAPWRGRLSLVFASSRGATILEDRRTEGPVALQKILYPEGTDTAHTFILHPPSGVAGGDDLMISVRVMPKAHALITTPGATRWYKSNGRLARQEISLTIEDEACMEWLPSENIFFDQVDAQIVSKIHLQLNSRFIGWELMQFGQRESLATMIHRWRQARVDLSGTVTLHGQLDWLESARFSEEDLRTRPLMQGTGGYAVMGTLWAYSPELLIEDSKDQWRGQIVLSSCAALRAGMTQLSSGLVIYRVLGLEADRVRDELIGIWERLRPWVAKRRAELLRIWAT